MTAHPPEQDEAPGQRRVSRKPPVRTLVNCAACGAIMKRHDVKCWLCDAPADVGGPENPIQATLAEPPVGTAGDSHFAVLGLAAALIVACVGVGFVAPAGGIALAVFICPALIRTVVVSMRSGVGGMGVGQTIYTFIAAIGVVILAGCAAACAFFVTCCAACFGIVFSNGSTNNIEGPLLFFGGLGGLFLAGLVLYAFWKKQIHSP